MRFYYDSACETCKNELKLQKLGSHEAWICASGSVLFLFQPFANDQTRAQMEPLVVAMQNRPILGGPMHIYVVIMLVTRHLI